MSNTRAVLQAAAYYIGNGGYYEKKDGTAAYLTRDVSNFAANKGSANYTYFGKVCGVNPGAWCAMFVSTCVLEAYTGDKVAAKNAMYGIWPYTACNQLFDAALPKGKAHYSYYQRTTKGKPGSAYTPKPGDVIVFSYNGSSRDHTGLVCGIDSKYVYTYEGNTSDRAAQRSYLLTNSSIYGYVELNMTQSYGSSASTTTAPATDGIRLIQDWLEITVDGKYGPKTKAAIIRQHQKYLNAKHGAGLVVDGEWGPETYYATQPLQKGDNNNDVVLWQGLLFCLGYDPVTLDGVFGSNTEKATIALQKDLGLTDCGVADRYTWAKALGYARPAHTILRKGSRGAEVKYLQRLLLNHGLTLKIDGVFGDLTATAVERFQDANGLTVDAQVGPKTWGKLE